MQITKLLCVEPNSLEMNGTIKPIVADPDIFLLISALIVRSPSCTNR